MSRDTDLKIVELSIKICLKDDIFSNNKPFRRNELKIFKFCKIIFSSIH